MRRITSILTLGLIGSATCLGAAAAAPATAGADQRETCVVVDQSTKEVRPGVRLTWDSSFRCLDAPADGAYDITVEVTNASSSERAATVEDLWLRHTTPRPRGQGPEASAEPGGLPLTLGPGETAQFTVTGSYELVPTDEGDKANLHLTAEGSADGRFELGINVHLRG